MKKLTKDLERSVCYDPWEFCGLDGSCIRSCHGCKIPAMIEKLMRYEDTGLEPEEIKAKLKNKDHTNQQ
jgi:hypothetical protein